jgi:hypothetical protein
MRTNYAPVHCLLRCKAVKADVYYGIDIQNGEKNIEGPLYLSISIPCVYDIIICII